MIYKTHYIIFSSETMVCKLIYQRGKLGRRFITIFYYEEALLQLSNRITVKA